MLGPSAMPAFKTPELPAWVSASVRAESDRLVMEMTAPTASSGTGNHSSVLASSLPGSTVAVLEDHSVGTQVNKLLDQLTTMGPSMGLDASAIKQVQSALGLVGGIDWIGDTAVAVTDDSGTIGGGVVVQTPDAATAKSKLAQLSALLALGGASTGLHTSTETYHGQTITVITIPQSSQSVGGGISLSTDPIEIGLTTKDNLIVAGYKDVFAKAVIDTTSANALSSQSDFNSVMNAVTASNAGWFYLNTPAIKDQLGKMAVNSSDWNLNYKPYFDHLGGIGFASIDGSTSTVRFVLMAR